MFNNYLDTATTQTYNT